MLSARNMGVPLDYLLSQRHRNLFERSACVLCYQINSERVGVDCYKNYFITRRCEGCGRRMGFGINYVVDDSYSWE